MTELELNEILKCDENPPAEFNVNLVTAFSAIVRDEGKTYEESIKDVNLDIACTQLFPNCSMKSKPHFIENCVTPALELKLIAQTHPESPRHPQQKYYLTELGKALQRKLKEEQ